MFFFLLFASLRFCFKNTWTSKSLTTAPFLDKPFAQATGFGCLYFQIRSLSGSTRHLRRVQVWEQKYPPRTMRSAQWMCRWNSLSWSPAQAQWHSRAHPSTRSKAGCALFRGWNHGRPRAAGPHGGGWLACNWRWHVRSHPHLEEWQSAHRAHAIRWCAGWSAGSCRLITTGEDGSLMFSDTTSE